MRTQATSKCTEVCSFLAPSSNLTFSNVLNLKSDNFDFSCMKIIKLVQIVHFFYLHCYFTAGQKITHKTSLASSPMWRSQKCCQKPISHKQMASYKNYLMYVLLASALQVFNLYNFFTPFYGIQLYWLLILLPYQCGEKHEIISDYD